MHHVVLKSLEASSKAMVSLNSSFWTIWKFPNWARFELLEPSCYVLSAETLVWHALKATSGLLIKHTDVVEQPGIFCIFPIVVSRCCPLVCVKVVALFHTTNLMTLQHKAPLCPVFATHVLLIAKATLCATQMIRMAEIMRSLLHTCRRFWVCNRNKIRLETYWCLHSACVFKPALYLDRTCTKQWIEAVFDLITLRLQPRRFGLPQSGESGICMRHIINIASNRATTSAITLAFLAVTDAHIPDLLMFPLIALSCSMSELKSRNPSCVSLNRANMLVTSRLSVTT